MIRAIIERKAKEGMESQFWETLFNLRSKAMEQMGCISSEIRVALDDPLTHKVISTWHTVEEWLAWAHSKEREAEETAIQPLLASPAKITMTEVPG